MVTKVIADNWCNTFKGRYVTLKKFMTLKERECHFHFGGHWNVLYIEDDHLCHAYQNGDTGLKEKIYSKILLSEIGKYIYVPYEGSFITFKIDKYSGLRTDFRRLELSTFDSIDEKHRFLMDNGFKLHRRLIGFKPSGEIEFINSEIK